MRTMLIEGLLVTALWACVPDAPPTVAESASVAAPIAATAAEPMRVLNLPSPTEEPRMARVSVASTAAPAPVVPGGASGSTPAVPWTSLDLIMGDERAMVAQERR